MNSNIISIYFKKDKIRLYQGDLYKDILFFEYSIKKNELIESKLPYLIILSQDCDLNQDFNAMQKKEKLNQDTNNQNNDNSIVRKYDDKLIPSILTCPGFPAEQVRLGSHLEENDLFMDEKGNEKKTKWKNILQNETSRYHYVEGDKELGIPSLVFDFKRYYTIPRDNFYSQTDNNYLATLNTLFRENISNRFSNYISRIGLPEVKSN